MKKSGFIITLLLFGVMISLFFFLTSQYEKGLEKKSRTVSTEISGTLESEEVDVNVKIPGKISKIYVEEGDSVFSGEVIAKLDAENIEAKVAQAKAVLEMAKAKKQQAEIAYKAQQEQSDNQIKQARAVSDAAEAQMNKAKAGARPQQIAQAKEVVEQAKKGYELSKTTYERLQKLYNDGILPQQKIDMAKTDMEVSENKYNAASQQYEMLKEGAQKEDIQSAEALYNQAQAAYSLAQTTKLLTDARAQDISAAAAQVLQAEAALAEAQSYLKDSTIKSPIAGIVTLKGADSGELVSTGMPLVTISNLKKIWLNVKISENEVFLFKQGQSIDVYMNGMPDKAYKGKVTYISAKPSYATERATQERGSRDIVSFSVKIKIDNSDMRLRPGMTGYIALPKSAD